MLIKKEPHDFIAMRTAQEQFYWGLFNVTLRGVTQPSAFIHTNEFDFCFYMPAEISLAQIIEASCRQFAERPVNWAIHNPTLPWVSEDETRDHWVWCRNSDEVEEMRLMNRSADDLWKENIRGMSLPERLIFGLQRSFFQRHLTDVRTQTMCIGSSDFQFPRTGKFGGCLPVVSYCDNRFLIDIAHPTSFKAGNAGPRRVRIV